MLRPYQQEAITALRHSLAKGNKRPLLQAPTGCGKTVIATAITHAAVSKGNRVLFLAPRRELIHQAHDRFSAHELDVGMIMAGEPRNLYAPVQVASFDTLHSRALRREKMMMPDASVVIVDEAHLAIARTRREIIDHYSDKVIIGLTATPARGDGRGLGEIFDDLVLSWPMKKLVDHGYLVPAKYFAGSEPDLEGIGLNKDGDYIGSQLAKRVDQPKLVGDVVRNWQRIAGDKRTVVFGVNCAHSRHLAEEFRRVGVTAEHLDAHTPLDERAEILKRMLSGETQVLCNVFVATFGWDCPPIECAVLARPTRNISLYLQTCGRVLRPYGGKEHATIIDHAGAVALHGFLDDWIPWSLDAHTSVTERKEKQKKDKAEPKEILCPGCSTVFKGQRECPNCGAQIIPRGKPIPVHEATLEEVKAEKAKDNRTATMEEKAQFLSELTGYARVHGYKEGWTKHKYREKFGVWPNKVPYLGPTDPTPETLNWIKSRQIAWAKRRPAA